ncbi:type I-E CRISPR-associated protein Cse2/CasB [Lactobacillus sp. CBA3605]|uniref:type I-E CRISPR-associated protein Cse2/CasB n=1 Tax=Lactobacillus sp. CBA3605 TaxID=2099788 RepID=UPI000CFAD1AC|nr:type I-E CRISPR-associated protein Cse2/CasB [Lactobacillus sp. CBA3605]AVK61551.1 type I-E CRISPR-associated protein Cse2/CasB [Lactobacillus sp. CBA3605]
MTGKIATTTARIIKTLYRNGEPNKAVLADLRSAATVTSQRAQGVWPIMMANLERYQLSRDGVPTSAEVAVYAALRFYAIQQQGQTQLVYESAENGNRQAFFSALAQLRAQEETRVALDRRVQPLLATTNPTSVINGLAQLVKILKANDRQQKIDYAWLAQDLYGLQASYEQANRVRLRWGQQYFWIKQATTKNEGAQN